MKYHNHHLYYIFTVQCTHCHIADGVNRKFVIKCVMLCAHSTLPQNTHALFAERGNGTAVGQPPIHSIPQSLFKKS